MGDDTIKTIREMGDSGTTRGTGGDKTTKEVTDDEARHQRHDGEITERTKASGAEMSATGHGFVAAGEATLSKTEIGETDARPCFYLVVRIGSTWVVTVYRGCHRTVSRNFCYRSS